MIKTVLYEDSRQQIGKHNNVHEYCEKNGIKIVRQALNVGDYQIAGKGDIAVDTKYSVLELANCIYKDHIRFRNELLRAKEQNIQLIILTEEELPGGLLSNWVSPVYKGNTRLHKRGEPMSKINPVNLRKAMYTMIDKYGVKFYFCPKDRAGEYVLDYLEGRRK